MQRGEEDWTGLDEAVTGTIERLGRFMREQSDAWAIPPAAGRFLHGLVLATGAGRLLELGTSYGYSGLWLGWAAKKNHGRLITIEAEQHKSAIAAEHFKQAGLDGVILPRVAKIADVLAEIAGPFDFVFIDADKSGTWQYVDLLIDKLTPRATIVTDNVISHEEASAGSLEYLRSHRQLWSTTLPIGSGLELTIKVE